MLPNKLKEKCNELADYFDRPAWKNRTLFYLSIFTSIAAVFLIVFGIFKLIFPDLSILSNTAHTQYNATQLSDMGFFDNERYLLSALVQSLAATIALVITLSLVAVQLAAQSYSARVIDVYKRNPDMWILLCIYIITIFYGLGLIKVVELGVSGINMEGAIFVAYFMGFFAFVCLVPYIWNILASLKPSNMMETLAEQIKNGNIQTLIQKINEDDPALPIIDIISSALEKNDDETVKNGLKAITDVAIYMCQKVTPRIEYEEKLLRHLLSHIKNIGIKSIIKNNVNSITFSIISLKKIGHEAANNKLKDTVKDIISWLAEIEKNTRDKEFRFEAIEEIISSLDDIETVCADKEMDTAISHILRIIGTMKLQYEDDLDIIIIKKIVPVIQKIGEYTVKNEQEDDSRDAINILKRIGMEIAKKPIIDMYWDSIETEIIKAIESVGQIWIDKNKNDRFAEIPYYAIEALENIGTSIVRKKSSHCSRCTILILKTMAKKSQENNLPRERTAEAINAIGQIGQKTIEMRNESLLFNTIKVLEDIANINVDDDAIVNKIIKIYKTIATKESEHSDKEHENITKWLDESELRRNDKY